jgi:predicted nucleic acid-binding protein
VARSQAVFVTTPFVVAETHAMVLRRRGPRAGQEFLRAALGGSHVRVVHATPELMASAVTEWVMHFADQRFSLCDAVSFEVMRRERIRRVLTRDRHFATAGFEIVS